MNYSVGFKHFEILTQKKNCSIEKEAKLLNLFRISKKLSKCKNDGKFFPKKLFE